MGYRACVKATSRDEEGKWAFHRAMLSMWASRVYLGMRLRIEMQGRDVPSLM